MGYLPVLTATVLLPELLSRLLPVATNEEVLLSLDHILKQLIK